MVCIWNDDVERTVEDELDKEEKTETKKDKAAILKKLGYKRFLIKDPWTIGKHRIAKSNIRELKTAAREQLAR